MVQIIDHPEYTERLPQWQAVQDTASPTGVKDARTTYLPYVGDPQNADDVTAYDRYLKRAQFYGFTAETVRGLVGLAFDDGITLEDNPEGLEYLETNIDGDGLGIQQSAQKTTRDTVKQGRAGLLVDYPNSSGTVTRSEAAEKGLRASVISYDAFQVRNWQSRKYGALRSLSLVSLAESVDVVQDDGLTVKPETQERRLVLTDELDDGGNTTGARVYQVEIYRDNDGDSETPVETYVPRKADGKPFDYIPFFFIGSDNNDTTIDDSPMFPIADLNVGHYRNSADYENSIFMLQPQPWASGLSQAWVDKNMTGFRLGSGALLALPVGGQFGIEQPEPNTIAFEGMEYKQKAMIALGAKMLTADISFNTAREAMLSNGPTTSKLQTIVNNVETAYNDALTVVGEFMGIEPPVFVVNADLSKLAGDAQLAAVMVNAWMSGLIGKTDARDYMRAQGLIERTDEDIDGDLETEGPDLDLDDDNGDEGGE